MLKEQSDKISQAKSHLDEIQKIPFSLEEFRDRSIQLASLLLQEGSRVQKPQERQRQEQIAQMVSDPIGKTFTSIMADQCFRAKSHSRVADQLVFLLNKFGIPQYLSPFKRFQMKLFQWMGKPFSAVAVPAMMFFMRKETEAVILPGEGDKLDQHISKRHQEGVRINLNHLGEAILGEEEALRRLQIYVDDLANPQVEYISIKISTIYSQINLLAWNETIEILAERLRKLYRAAKNSVHVRPDGTQVQKFVNLDMEEYRDLGLTVALFKKVLEEEEFKNFSAGIVLQAYLPDSHEIQKELTSWAIERRKKVELQLKSESSKAQISAWRKSKLLLRDGRRPPMREKLMSMPIINGCFCSAARKNMRALCI